MTGSFESLRERGRVRWLGLMSGTSCDGIDAALVECEESPSSAKFIAGHEFKFAPQLSQRLLRDLAAVPSAESCARWHAELGELFADAAEQAQQKLGEFDAIAVSGHTFAHLPEERVSLQLGCPARVAVRLSRPVVANFRTADIARGGEGAPLVPVGDRRLFSHLGKGIVILNIGGISNFTFLPSFNQEPLASDCGPGNLILNETLRQGTAGRQQVDWGGKLAAQGQVHGPTIQEWMQHPFIASAQRSTGREQFGEPWVSRQQQRWQAWPLADRLATCSRYIAKCIQHRLQKLCSEPIRRILVGGGGAHHQTLISDIKHETGLVPEKLQQQEHGVSADYREAAAFAILGQEFLHHRPGSFKSTTGLQNSGPLGSLHLP